MNERRTCLRLSDIDMNYAKAYLKSVIKSVGSGVHDKRKDMTCWSMFYSKMKNSDYDYLTKYGDYDIPVNVRFHSIVKPNIDWLVSKYLGNPFNFSVKTTDKKSLNDKYEQKINAYVESVIQGIESNYLQLQTQLELIGNKQQEINMMAQQQPENEEMAKQLEMIKQQLPMINLQLTQMTNALKREQKRVSEKMDKAELLSKFKPKDMREDLLQRKLVSFYEENNIGNVHKWTMTEKCVTGKPYIYVDIENNKLTYKYLPSYSVFHPKNASIDGVEDGDWIAYEEFLSYDQVISRYGDELNGRDLKKLELFATNYASETNPAFELYEDDDQGAANYVNSYKPVVSRNQIRVLHVFWQASVQIEAIKSKTSDNQYEFTKIKKDSDIPKGNQRVEKRFKQYLLQGTVIMDHIYCDVKLRDKQFLKVDDFGWNQLPIVGDSFDDIGKVPYSIIWATRDLQALYQIIEYYEELLLVISGVKGFVMDKSQLPTGMSEKEWAYMRKLGTMWIETYKKERRQQTSFNQFAQYDDSIPASIQYLGMMKDRIQQRVDQITGVTRLARGETEPRDAVGNTKLSVQATNIIADVLFWEHDQVIRRSLTRAMNLYAKFIGKDGETFSIFDRTIGETDIIEVPKGLLNGADYDCQIMNNNKDIRDIQELKQIIGAEYSRGNVDMGDMIKVFQSTSITEMRVLAEHLYEKKVEAAQASQQGALEAEKQIKEFEAQLEMKIKEGDQNLKNIENQLTKLELDLKNKEIEYKKEIEDNKIKSNNFVKMLDIATDFEKEKNRLDAEERSIGVDQALKKAELLTQMILGSQKNMIDDKKLDTRVNKE
jgi:hypothetical protein